MKIETEKTDYGFQYRLGNLVIARGEFVKRKTGWKIKLWHMKDIPTRVGIATCDGCTVLEVRETFDYINNLMYPTPPFNPTAP